MLTNPRTRATCLTFLTLVSLLNRCSSNPTETRGSTDYILDSFLPDQSDLASKLLSAIALARPARTPYLLPLLRDDEDVGQLELNDVIDVLRPAEKRGLGQCIHNCINGRGNMNFIQCKSMCH